MVYLNSGQHRTYYGIIYNGYLNSYVIVKVGISATDISTASMLNSITLLYYIILSIPNNNNNKVQ